MELPPSLYVHIERLSAEGSRLFDREDYAGAVERWSEALELLPEPRSDWEAFTWLSASIGDAKYHLGALEEARESMLNALNGPDGQANPFIHYRLGQCNVRLGDEEPGCEDLLRAYMLDGERVFAVEPDGAGYLQLLRERDLVS